MKIANTRFKKIALIVVSSIIIAIMVVVLLISPITKYVLEKNGIKYFGRKVKMSWVYVNPFTGYVHISHLKIYESKDLSSLTGGDSIFFSANGVSANFAMRKLLSKTIEISEITLYSPKGIIIQNKKDLNLNDLIKRFTPEKNDTTPSKVHFNILHISIKNGEFYYREQITPINYFIKEANFESSGKYWNADTMAVKFSFLSGNGNGSANGNFTLHFKNMDYRLAVVLHTYDLNLIGQYLKALTNFGYFTANVDADIQATGNLNDQENLNLSGLLAINDFHIGKTQDNDYTSFEKCILKIDKLSPKNHLYLFDSLSLVHPYFKYERYDYLDNLQTMFGKKGAKISAAKADPAKFNLILQIADYVKVLAKNFFKSDYKINRLAIYNGRLKFNDYSLTEKFSAEVNPLCVIADSVNKDRKRVEVTFKSGLKPYGNTSVILSINPKDSGDFDMHYHLQGLPVSMFNPYMITYTSFPLDRGTIELNGTWNVRNSIIKSVNHLLVIDPRISKRLRNKDTKWIPSPLIMFFIRERGNVIDYEIPITGNLKSPKFHLHDVIFDLLGNIFTKPPTTPYRMQVKNAENVIEKSLTLKWEMRQCSLPSNQEKFVNKMVDFLVSNPEASIAIYPMQYAEKEKEYIAFFEAKKKYVLLSKDANSQFLSEDDSSKVDKMSVKDPDFDKYLNNQASDSLLFTQQEKCSEFVGLTFINAKFKELTKAREEVILAYFKKKDVEKRVKIYAGENVVPYNGFSFYKIAYKGEFPESLVKAYQEMDELNHEAPRKRFEKERKNVKM